LFLQRRSGKFSDYISFNEAKKIVSKLKIKSLKDWRDLSITVKKNNNLPSIPERQYKNEWKGWGDFLGTGRISTIYFKNFIQARKFARNLKLRSSAEWRKKVKGRNLPEGIPADPRSKYKSQFKGWADFLGTNNKPGGQIKPRSRKT